MDDGGEVLPRTNESNAEIWWLLLEGTGIIFTATCKTTVWGIYCGSYHDIKQIMLWYISPRNYFNYNYVNVLPPFLISSKRQKKRTAAAHFCCRGCLRTGRFDEQVGRKIIIFYILYITDFFPIKTGLLVRRSLMAGKKSQGKKKARREKKSESSYRGHIEKKITSTIKS